MQTELINLWIEFEDLRSVFLALTLILLITSWHLVNARAGRTMTQRRYSATIMALSVAIPPFSLLLPLGIMAVNHPGFFSVFLGFLIAEFPSDFVLPLVYVLIAVIGGWYFAKVYPVGEKHESKSESQPEHTEGPAGS